MLDKTCDTLQTKSDIHVTHCKSEVDLSKPFLSSPKLRLRSSFSRISGQLKHCKSDSTIGQGVPETVVGVDVPLTNFGSASSEMVIMFH